jgi:hypothetical protein
MPARPEVIIRSDFSERPRRADGNHIFLPLHRRAIAGDIEVKLRRLTCHERGNEFPPRDAMAPSKRL